MGRKPKPPKGLMRHISDPLYDTDPTARVGKPDPLEAAVAAEVKRELRRPKAKRNAWAWNKQMAKQMKNIAAVGLATNLLSQLAANTSPARMAKVDANWDRHHRRLCDIENALGRIEKVLELDHATPRLPLGYKLTWDGKKRHGALSPVGIFVRGLLLGLPFTVNGIKYWSVKKKEVKP